MHFSRKNKIHFFYACVLYSTPDVYLRLKHKHAGNDYKIITSLGRATVDESRGKSQLLYNVNSCIGFSMIRRGFIVTYLNSTQRLIFRYKVLYCLK